MQTIARAVIPVNRSDDRGRLEAANQRLLALRKMHSRPKTESAQPINSADATLPPHLGWGSLALARLKTPTPPVATHKTTPLIPLPTQKEPPKTQPTTPTNYPTNLKLHPALALAFLKQEQTTPARAWLLLRRLDQAGRGWVSVADARATLTNKQSRWRICGWRQLRNCLRAGQGVFWQRDTERIWLRSIAKVAVALNVARLDKPVELPIKRLLGRIQTVRAHFYAVQHHKASSRRLRCGPISRATLTTLSGVSERTQRRYDAVANIEKRPNYCLQSAHTDPQELAWHHQHATFDFIDKQGRHGPKGKKYRAFQLPNSYSASFKPAALGRTRKINQQLQQDLVKFRAQGNSCKAVDQAKFGPKLFFGDERRPKQSDKDIYVKINQNAQRAFWTHWA